MPFLDPEELKPKLREVFETVVIPQIKKAKMKQTAVEFFAEELNKWRTKEFGEEAIIGIPIEVLEEANKLFEQQIIDAWLNSLTKGDYNSAEEYYNKTFKSE